MSVTDDEYLKVADSRPFEHAGACISASLDESRKLSRNLQIVTVLGDESFRSVVEHLDRLPDELRRRIDGDLHVFTIGE